MQRVQATGMVDERPRSGMACKTIRRNDRSIREQRKATHKTAATVNRSSAASVESIT